MASTSPRQPRNWARKFGDALRGCGIAFRRQPSFWVHAVCAVAVLLAGTSRPPGSPGSGAPCSAASSPCWWPRCSTRPSKQLAKAVDRDFNPHIRDALDMGSAAVLLAAVGAVAIGAVVFLL